MEEWPHSLPRVLETVDVALLDGTFFSASELPGRDLAEIPHPLVQATAALLAGTPAQIRFIHLNHKTLSRFILKWVSIHAVNTAQMDAFVRIQHEGYTRSANPRQRSFQRST